jgi:hypothetical protein
VADKAETPRRPLLLPLELSNEPLDVRAIVLGTLAADAKEEPDRPSPAPPAVVWRGTVPSDSGSRAGYWVQLLADGTGQCSCADYYFRGVLRREPEYTCKHLRRVRASRS